MPRNPPKPFRSSIAGPMSGVVEALGVVVGWLKAGLGTMGMTPWPVYGTVLQVVGWRPRERRDLQARRSRRDASERGLLG
jgi:hypothetical protein